MVIVVLKYQIRRELFDKKNRKNIEMVFML